MKARFFKSQLSMQKQSMKLFALGGLTVYGEKSTILDTQTDLLPEDLKATGRKLILKT